MFSFNKTFPIICSRQCEKGILVLVPQMFDLILFIMKLLSLSSIVYLELKIIHVYITRYFWHVHFTNSYVIIKLQLRPIIILRKSVNNHENTEICTL